MDPSPYFREAGTGEGVVCLHSNASASVQWRPLMERLSSHFHVFAPDSLGAGKSPAWPKDQTVGLSDEVALLEPVFALAGSPLSLVGHSYGGAIALISALTHPKMLRALVLYEPTLFSLLEEEAPGQDAANEIREVAADAAAAIEAKDPSAAAARFINYWMGNGTWDAMPDSRQAVVAASMFNVRGWAQALFGDSTPLHVFRALEVPVLYMVGAKSPPSSRNVARLLTGALPKVTMIEFSELGHMGPVTHPEQVNTAIARFLEE
ncbi:alpha/beta hydrolase [Gammaproteobacteria bacterium]|nr:alpha/beta hydrolase [Gammaproteobacteria bacterium]